MSAAPEFTDRLVEALRAKSLKAEIASTGGGCMAVVVVVTKAVGDFAEILVTDGDADLPDGEYSVVGYYDGEGYDDGVFLEGINVPVEELVEAISAKVEAVS